VIEMDSNFSIKTKIIVEKCAEIGLTVYQVIYAYNFFVYLITGKLFRSDLRKLLCRCSTSFSSPAPAIIALAHAHGAPAPAVIAAAAAVDDDDDDDDDVGGGGAEVARRDVRADTAV